MDHQVTGQTITAEVCGACGSLDVRAVEPAWFTVGLDRRDELHDVIGTVVKDLEFGCRDCGARWS